MITAVQLHPHTTPYNLIYLSLTERVGVFCLRWRVRLFHFNSLFNLPTSFRNALTFLLRSRERENVKLMQTKRFSVSCHSPFMQCKSLFWLRLKLLSTHCLCEYVSTFDTVLSKEKSEEWMSIFFSPSVVSCTDVRLCCIYRSVLPFSRIQRTHLSVKPPVPSHMGRWGSRDSRRKRLNYRIHDNRPTEQCRSTVQNGHGRETGWKVENESGVTTLKVLNRLKCN